MGYLWHLGKGQARILLGMQPVERFLRQADLPPGVREKILLVQDAKSFGEDVLGLAPSRSYTYYYEGKVPPLGYNLTASPALELEAHRWCFPVAGCVPYKGFFQKKRAEREAGKMREEGYDVYLRPLVAYSTLGWFPDPIFSTWLKADGTFLVETVLHEMTHGTIYVQDESDFNESVATFIGEQGTLAFFESRASGSATFSDALRKRWKDQEAFRAEMAGLAERLRALYASGRDEAEKRREKDRLYRETKQAFLDRLSPEQERWFAWILDVEWNNAFLAAHLTYHGGLALWEESLRGFGGDLPALIEALKKLKGEKDPLARVRAWGRPGTEPGEKAD